MKTKKTTSKRRKRQQNDENYDFFQNIVLFFSSLSSTRVIVPRLLDIAAVENSEVWTSVKMGVEKRKEVAAFRNSFLRLFKNKHKGHKWRLFPKETQIWSKLIYCQKCAHTLRTLILKHGRKKHGQFRVNFDLVCVALERNSITSLVQRTPHMFKNVPFQN